MKTFRALRKIKSIFVRREIDPVKFMTTGRINVEENFFFLFFFSFPPVVQDDMPRTLSVKDWGLDLSDRMVDPKIFSLRSFLFAVNIFLLSFLCFSSFFFFLHWN